LGTLIPHQASEVETLFFENAKEADIIRAGHDVLMRSISLAGNYPVRTLDALRIAAAIRGESDRFVTADKRQALVARMAGLKVLEIKHDERN